MSATNAMTAVRAALRIGDDDMVDLLSAGALVGLWAARYAISVALDAREASGVT
jgi:hypothetical protein